VRASRTRALAALAAVPRRKNVLELLAATPDATFKMLLDIILAFAADEDGSGKELLCLQLTCALFSGLFSVGSTDAAFSEAEACALRARAEHARWARLTRQLPDLRGTWMAVLIWRPAPDGRWQVVRIGWHLRLLPGSKVPAGVADLLRRAIKALQGSSGLPLLCVEFLRTHLRPSALTAVLAGAPDIEEVQLDFCSRLSTEQVQ
jgi:hypothetical protein